MSGIEEGMFVCPPCRKNVLWSKNPEYFWTLNTKTEGGGIVLFCEMFPKRTKCVRTHETFESRLFMPARNSLPAEYVVNNAERIECGYCSKVYYKGSKEFELVIAFVQRVLSEDRVCYE